MKALITGITGQDGAYLAKFLLEKGYDVHGTQRSCATDTTWRLKRMGILDDVRVLTMDLTERKSITHALWSASPDEVYNLAAQSFVGDSFRTPDYTQRVNGAAVVTLLEEVLQFMPETRVYQASTSEMFGRALNPPLHERSPFHTCSPYAASKLYAHQMCGIYREAHGMHISCGILFNHESALRGHHFVTQKIATAACRKEPVRLGNVGAIRDWGYAGDYVEAMWLMLQRDEPDDYVVGTGQGRSVNAFITACEDVTGERIEVIQDDSLLRPVEVPHLVASPMKAERELGWRPKTDFKELVRKMVEDEL